MILSGIRLVAAVLLVSAALVGERAMGDLEKDRAECQDTLLELSTCITYIQMKSAAPAPDCCDDLKQVLATNKKCMCTLVKDRDEPNLGFKFNATRALLLPDVCKYSTRISECVTLLGLAPHSQAAQIFEQFESAGNTTAATTAGASGKGDAVKNGGGRSRCSVRGWPLRAGGGLLVVGVATILLTGLIITIN